MLEGGSCGEPVRPEVRLDDERPVVERRLVGSRFRLYAGVVHEHVDRSVAFGGRLFKLTAILTVVGLLFGDYALYFLLVPALLTAGGTIVYSYYLYERLDRNSETTSGSNL